MAPMTSLFLLLVLIQQSESVNIDGTGATGGSPMMKQWGFSYSLLKPSVKTVFTPTSGREAFKTLQARCRGNFQADYIVSDINWLSNITGDEDTDVVVVPLFAAALVLSYNFPTLDPEKTEQLILSRELIYQIFSENLTWWNDSRMIQENPHIPFPEQRIRLIIREDDSGFTETMSSMLEKMDNEAGHPFRGVRTDFKASRVWLREFKNANKTKSSFQMASAILTTDWSLGYVALSYADQAGLTYARLTNRETIRTRKLIDPTDFHIAASVEEVLKTMKITEVTNYNLSDITGAQSYPLTSLYFLAYHSNVEVECEQRREVMKFLNWILTSDAADQQINGTVGYTPFQKDARMLVLSLLDNTTCGGNENLRLEYAESSSTALRQVAMSLSSVMLTIVLLIGITMGLKRNNRITKAAGLAFATCFLLGCGLNYISVLVWALVPNNDSVCEARYILVAVGYTLLLGSMFAKCWEVRKIFARAHSGDISPFQEVPWWKFCIVFFSVISVNLLLLLGLGAADPPQTAVDIVNPLEIIAIHTCTVQHLKIWAALEFSYFGGLVSWGGYLAYQTREIWEKYNYPNESRSILLSIYNLVFCLSILLPLMSVLSGQTEVVFFFVATAIIFPTTFALFTVYGPKMLIFLSSSFRAGGDSRQGNKTTKASRQAQSGISARPLERDLPPIREGERFIEPEESSGKRKAHQSQDFREEKAIVIVEEDHGEQDEQMLAVESSSQALLAKFKELDAPPSSPLAPSGIEMSHPYTAHTPPDASAETAAAASESESEAGGGLRTRVRVSAGRATGGKDDGRGVDKPMHKRTATSGDNQGE